MNKFSGWVAGFFFVAWFFSFLQIPLKPSPAKIDAGYDKAFSVLKNFIAEAGMEISFSNTTDEAFKRALATTIAGLQQHPVWGWRGPSDGVISAEFLQHLSAKAKAYSDENIKRKVLDFISAVATLQKNKHIWELSQWRATSLAFANGIFVGWADDFGAWVYNRDDSRKREAARDDYKNAVLLGEAYYPVATLVFTILGTIFSVFGVIAVWMARNADNEKHAFKLGFWAEIGESALFQFGYFYTTKKMALR